MEVATQDLKLHLRGAEWELFGGGLQFRALAPELRGVAGPRGTAWALVLPLQEATVSKEHVDVPNVVKAAEGLVISSRSPVASSLPAVAFSWRLTLALHEGGLFTHLALELGSGAPEQVTLGHVSMAAVELREFSSEDDKAASKIAGSDGSEAAALLEAPPRQNPCRRRICPCAATSRGIGHSSFLVNGWQSFSFSGVLHGAAKQPKTTLQFFSGAFHHGASMPPHAESQDPGCLVSDMFGVLWLHRSGGGVLAGFLSQKYGFGGLAAHTSGTPAKVLLYSEVGAEVMPGLPVELDWAVVTPLVLGHAAGAAGSGMHAMERYLAFAAAHQQVPPCKPAPVGWCSWYCHGPEVSEELMNDSLRRLVAFKDAGELPMTLFQLDDGWQSAWGDWLSPNLSRFPNGVKPLATAVRKAGLVPGIWLAPAAVVSHSEVAKQHPEWLLKDSKGRVVKCGFTAPGLWMKALDVTHPEVLAHVKNVIHTIVHEWGFSYIKCDFLHCAAMPGARRYDPRVSRAGALRLLMEVIRSAAGPDTFVLACGAPLGPCVGLADAVRVSADTAEHWLPKGPDMPGTRWFFAADRTNLPAARNMVCSTMARFPMNGKLWINDPDCLILRDDFSLQEAQALATVAAFSAGSLIFSDSVDKVKDERMAILKALLPPMPRVAGHVDLLARDIPGSCASDMSPHPGAQALGPWKLIGLYHWTEAETPCDLEVPGIFESGDGQDWHIFEFWSGSYTRHRGLLGEVAAPAVPARCCKLFAVRPMNPGSPTLVGSDVHVSCGLEIAHWREEVMATAVEITIEVGRAIQAPHVWLFLPGSSLERPPSLRHGSSKEAPVLVAGEVWRVTLPPVAATGGPMCVVQW